MSCSKMTIKLIWSNPINRYQVISWTIEICRLTVSTIFRCFQKFQVSPLSYFLFTRNQDLWSWFKERTWNNSIEIKLKMKRNLQKLNLKICIKEWKIILTTKIQMLSMTKKSNTGVKWLNLLKLEIKNRKDNMKI